MNSKTLVEAISIYNLLVDIYDYETSQRIFGILELLSPENNIDILEIISWGYSTNKNKIGYLKKGGRIIFSPKELPLSINISSSVAPECTGFWLTNQNLNLLITGLFFPDIFEKIEKSETKSWFKEKEKILTAGIENNIIDIIKITNINENYYYYKGYSLYLYIFLKVKLLYGKLGIDSIFRKRSTRITELKKILSLVNFNDKTSIITLLDENKSINNFLWEFEDNLICKLGKTQFIQILRNLSISPSKWFSKPKINKKHNLFIIR